MIRIVMLLLPSVRPNPIVIFALYRRFRILEVGCAIIVSKNMDVLHRKFLNV